MESGCVARHGANRPMRMGIRYGRATTTLALPTAPHASTTSAPADLAAVARPSDDVSGRNSGSVMTELRKLSSLNAGHRGR